MAVDVDRDQAGGAGSDAGDGGGLTFPPAGEAGRDGGGGADAVAPAARRQARAGSDVATGLAGAAVAVSWWRADRRLVIAKNRAWAAAADVRHRWLAASLFARRSVPREVHAFLARQLLAMPGPLRTGLAARPQPGPVHHDHRPRRRAVGPGLRIRSRRRLALAALAPVVTAYKHAMTDAEGRNTWRTDRYSPCPRSDAGTYLAYLASLGYQLSDIEHAVADSKPWTGDTPQASPMTESSLAADRGESPDDGTSNDLGSDVPAGSDIGTDSGDAALKAAA